MTKAAGHCLWAPLDDAPRAVDAEVDPVFHMLLAPIAIADTDVVVVVVVVWFPATVFAAASPRPVLALVVVAASGFP